MPKTSMKLSAVKALFCFATLVAVLSPVKAMADDHAQMIQFELAFGSKQMEHNLYMAMGQTGSLSRFDSTEPGTYRVPLISSNPHRTTLFSPLVKLYATEEASGSKGSGYEEPNPDASVGNFAGSLLVMALCVAPFIAAFSKSTDYDPCADGGCNIDLPPVDLPPVPVEPEK